MPPTPRDVTANPPQARPSLHPWAGPWLSLGLVPWVDSIAANVPQSLHRDGSTLPPVVASVLGEQTLWAGTIPAAWVATVGSGFGVALKTVQSIAGGQTLRLRLKAFGLVFMDSQAQGPQPPFLQGSGAFVHRSLGNWDAGGIFWGQWAPDPLNPRIPSATANGGGIPGPVDLALTAEFGIVDGSQVQCLFVRASSLGAAGAF